MAAKVLPGSRLKARRRRRRFVVVLFVFVALLVLAGMVIGFSWLPFIRIHTVSVSGASSINQASIESIAQADLTGTYYLVFPKDNIFLYPQSVIQNDLLSHFSVLESATIRRYNLQTIAITVVERSAEALWCGDAIASSSPCFLLDQSGVAYAPAADFSGEPYIKYYGPATGSAKKQFLTPTQFGSLAAFVAAIPQAIATDTPRAVEVAGGDVSVHLASGFVIKYSLSDDGADVLERLKLGLAADPFATHKLSDFEYIDLRFGDKLYYKLK